MKRGPSAALALVIATAGTALAADPAPRLVSPRPGQPVKAGRIRLLVRDTSSLARYGEYITVTHLKHLDRYGNLTAPTTCLARGCAFVRAKPVKGHPGEFAYTSKLAFPGYWAVTPGQYLWQAEHVDPTMKSGHSVSRIGSFRVGG